MSIEAVDFEGDDIFDNEVQAEEVTLIDLATASGYDLDWIQDEILHTMAMIGLEALDQDGRGAKTIRFTVNVGEEMPVEISVRIQDERKKARLH